MPCRYIFIFVVFRLMLEIGNSIAIPYLWMKRYIHTCGTSFLVIFVFVRVHDHAYWNPLHIRLFLIHWRLERK